MPPLSLRTRKKQTIIRDRIRPIAEALGTRWLAFCAKRTSRRVVSVFPRAHDSFAEDSFYTVMHEYIKSVEFFDVRLALDDPHRAGPLAPGTALEARLYKAVVTYNTCIDACVGFWGHLVEVFGGMDDCIAVEARYQHVRSRLMLFPSMETEGQERLFLHHYLVVRFTHGISFVLDFAGWQYGFEKVFYTLKEFEHEVLDHTDEPEIDDIQSRVKENQELALSDKRDIEQRKASELLDLIWSL